ncbi:MAG TPA: molybdopterin molybdotransferase MoeA [Saprospiraceae bacterium]|nr:molybdopterin molybdotransferase MoeA [Saprospiraceae bacterium]
MISAEEAWNIVCKEVKDFGTEQIELHRSLHRIVREEVTADRDFPPYDRVAMDGIAIRYKEYIQGTTSFHIQGIAAAGAPQMTCKKPQHCLEVMTGSIMPQGLDTVVPYEWIYINEHVADIQKRDVRHLQNIHFKGTDKRKGDMIIPPYTSISPAEIGVLATVGKSRVLVSKLPEICIISSGDELVDIHETPKVYQIRKSNVSCLNSVLQPFGIAADTYHLPDDLVKSISLLKRLINTYDVILMSGGISKGKFDYIPNALDQCGFVKLMDRVAQRPGKPFWFGKHPKGVLVFAFPGNPVSALTCMLKYFVPWLKLSMGIEKIDTLYARLSTEVHFHPDLTYFPEIRLQSSSEGVLMASPVKGSGSGDLANLSSIDGFMELPPHRSVFHPGEVYPVFTFRQWI